MLPVYGALHLIPTLVLRRQHFARDPLKMLSRVALGITRSCSFLGIYVVIYQSMCSRLSGFVILTTSTLLPAYPKSGKVDQERLLECDYEEKRDILVTWFLDVSQSLSRREGKPLPVYRSHS